MYIHFARSTRSTLPQFLLLDTFCVRIKQFFSQTVTGQYLILAKYSALENVNPAVTTHRRAAMFTCTAGQSTFQFGFCDTVLC